MNHKDEPRNTYVKFRVTEREKNNLRAFSRITGLSISELIRERCEALLKGDDLWLDETVTSDVE
jgi:hypothetical protein